MFQVHKNDTGSFQELAHASDVEFGQLSILTIEPSCERGGHYHTRKKEWFCCVHGSCWLILLNIRNGQSRTIILDEENREFVAVKPFEKHTALNPGARLCELLIIASEEFDPADLDTIKFEENKEN